MNIYIVVILTFLAVDAKCIVDLSLMQTKLWTSLENQITDLRNKQDQQKLKYNALKRVLRSEGLNVTSISELSNEDEEIDPFGYGSLNTIRNDFWMLKSLYEQKCTASLPFDSNSSHNSLEIQLDDIRKNQITVLDLESLRQKILQNFNTSMAAAAKDTAYYITQQPLGIETITQSLIIDSKLEKCTPNNLVYNFYPINGTEFKFKVRAQNDVHVALAHNAHIGHPIYEVILSGWANTKSVIRKDHMEDLVAVQNPGLLHECEYLSFWIRWDNNVIRAGHEGVSTPFMTYNVGKFYKVNFIGIHTGYGSTGSWIF